MAMLLALTPPVPLQAEFRAGSRESSLMLEAGEAFDADESHG